MKLLQQSYFWITICIRGLSCASDLQPVQSVKSSSEWTAMAREPVRVTAGESLVTTIHLRDPSSPGKIDPKKSMDNTIFPGTKSMDPKKRSYD